jgi:hypothetical protein
VQAAGIDRRAGAGQRVVLAARRAGLAGGAEPPQRRRERDRVLRPAGNAGAGQAARGGVPGRGVHPGRAAAASGLHVRSATSSIHAPALQDLPSVVVASEELDGERGWRMPASGELVHVRPDLTVESAVVLPDPRRTWYRCPRAQHRYLIPRRRSGTCPPAYSPGRGGEPPEPARSGPATTAGTRPAAPLGAESPPCAAHPAAGRPDRARQRGPRHPMGILTGYVHSGYSLSAGTALDGVHIPRRDGAGNPGGIANVW